MSTCRLCRDYSGPHFKYGTRHYAHASCGFKRWGRAFLDMLPTHQIWLLPAIAVREAGIGFDELERYIAGREQRGEIAAAKVTP